MSLEKQNVPLSLAVGIDTKRDEKQLNVGSLYNAENIVYQTIDSFQKRNGYRQLTNEIVDGSTYTNPRSISYLNAELQLFTNNNLYSYSPSVEKWVEKGNITNTRVISEPVLRNNFEQSEVQMAIVGNIQCFFWKDSRGGVRCTVLDSSTNTSLLSDVEVSATGIRPKLDSLDNLFFLFYMDGGALKYKTINSAIPTGLGTEQTLIAAVDVAASLTYSVKSISNKIFVAWDSDLSGGSLAVLSLSSDGSTDSTAALPGEDGSVAINISTDAQSRIVITYTGGAEVKILSYTFFLTTQPIVPTVVEVIADVTNITTIDVPNVGYRILYEVSNADSTKYFIKKAIVDSTGTVVLIEEFLRSVGLASEQILFNNKPYCVVVFASQLQSTYFITDENGLIISKFSPGVGGTIISPNALPQIESNIEGTFNIPTRIKGTGVADTSSKILYFLLGVNRTTFTFNSEINYQEQVLGKNLYVTGGVLLNYDGSTIVEDGFHVYPEGIGPVNQAISGGLVSDGQRQYSAVYMWTDNKGQLHRSAPSIPLTFTNNLGGSTQQNTITVPTLRLTSKQNVVIELYRTEALGTTFYKVTSTSVPIYNNKLVDSLNIVDGLSDTAILSNELLYTTGTVLDNIAAPAATTIAQYRNRIFLAGLEDQNKVAYSKLLTEGTPAEFNDALFIRVDDQNGGITAISTLDDKFIIFKESSIYVIAGDGPNNLGQQSDFTQPEAVASDVGCISPDSIVNTPNGVMFQSQKGIFLLDRGLTVRYIGADVERYNSETITSAQVAPNTNQIRFTTANNICLVYDYFVNRWVIFTNHGALDANVNTAIYTYLNNKEGRVWIETPNAYSDAGEQILMQFETGWVSFAGLQGFQRVYRMLCLGDLYSQHKLKISCAYDFAKSYLHDIIVDSSEFTSLSAYGDVSPYGEDAAYGGLLNDNNVYQLRVDFKKQKCQSIKIKIQELQNSPIGRGLSLSGFNFEVGAKRGLFKPGQGKIFGTSQ